MSASIARPSAAPARRPPSSTERLRERFYGNREHPYATYERLVSESLAPGAVLLDLGCGRTAATLSRLAPSTGMALGIDLVDFSNDARRSGTHVMNGDVAAIPLRSGSVDVVIARSVMEHVADPGRAYAEIGRVLKPGGRFVFLTPQLWDYASLIAKVVPNRFHPYLVNRVEGRAGEDTFPVHYRANTAGAIGRLAAENGFRVEALLHLNQYPCYLMFHPAPFLLGTIYERITSRWDALRALRGWLLAALRKE